MLERGQDTPQGKERRVGKVPYLDEFMWRNSFDSRSDAAQRILIEFANQYPLDGRQVQTQKNHGLPEIFADLSLAGVDDEIDVEGIGRLPDDLARELPSFELDIPKASPRQTDRTGH